MQSTPTQLLEVAEAYARAEIEPYAASFEAQREQPRATLQKAVGLTGLIVPESAGGHGAGPTTLARIAARLAAADLGIAFAIVVHNNLMGAVARFGSNGYHSEWLDRLASLDAIGAFLLTEANGGSDPARLQTTARKVAGGWQIDGTKAWVTNAVNADVLSVYAQTDPQASSRGIACLLVPADQHGVTRGEPYLMAGGHSLGAGGFEFDGCVVADDALLVPPGEGFRAAMQGIDLARAVVAAMSAGILGTCLDIAIERCKSRELFGQRLSDMQGMQWQLADVATDLHAIELLAYHATGLLDSGEPATVAAAHAKKFATRQLLAGVAQCMQAMGADGLLHDTPLARHYAAAKISQYIDGTTEIQNVVLSRALFR